MLFFFFFKQKTAYEISACLVGSEMCIRDSLGGIIVASVTNEMGVPSVASQIQRELEIPEAVCFDVNSACTGFMFALKAAEGLLRPGGKPFLVCGSETLSRFMNMEDRASCILSLIHISEPTRQAEISYAVFCLKKKKKKITTTPIESK